MSFNFISFVVSFLKSFNVISLTTYYGQEAQVEGGDPELFDDSEFYQQLLKEFFETIDPNSSGIDFLSP